MSDGPRKMFVSCASAASVKRRGLHKQYVFVDVACDGCGAALVMTPATRARCDVARVRGLLPWIVCDACAEAELAGKPIALMPMTDAQRRELRKMEGDHAARN